MIFRSKIEKLSRRLSETVARPCVVERSTVAERRTESELRRGERESTAFRRPSVSAGNKKSRDSTSEEDWIPPAKRGQTDELHKQVAWFYY